MYIEKSWDTLREENTQWEEFPVCSHNLRIKGTLCSHRKFSEYYGHILLGIAMGYGDVSETAWAQGKNFLLPLSRTLNTVDKEY